MLLVQCLSYFLYGAGSFISKGYSAAIQNGVSILRNLVACANIQGKFVEWGMVVLAVVLGVTFNNMGFVGLLPVISNFIYSVAVFKLKNNERSLKVVFIICVSMFAIFNLMIMNVVGVFANSSVAFMTFLYLLRSNKQPN